MKKLIILNCILFSTIFSFSQVVIKMKKQNGVNTIPCKVNGLNLSFIFDTGASDVSISLTEASFMYKNGFLKSSDFLGKAKFSDATGKISEGIVINLREIQIQGIKIYNVRASIVKKSNAPLLLGQSAISKLGRIEFNLKENILIIHNEKKQISKPISASKNTNKQVKKIPIKKKSSISSQKKFNKNKQIIKKPTKNKTVKTPQKNKKSKGKNIK